MIRRVPSSTWLISTRPPWLAARVLEGAAALLSPAALGGVQTYATTLQWQRSSSPLRRAVRTTRWRPVRCVRRRRAAEEALMRQRARRDAYSRRARSPATAVSRPSIAAAGGGSSLSFDDAAGLKRYHLQFYRGICLRSDVDTEVDNLLGMQSMIATVGSLVAGAWLPHACGCVQVASPAASCRQRTLYALDAVATRVQD